MTLAKGFRRRIVKLSDRTTTISIAAAITRIVTFIIPRLQIRTPCPATIVLGINEAAYQAVDHL
jgi:hypothetical protein